jgi:type IV pilus assembly protein PilQ
MVPFFGDIPFLGNLFKNRSNTNVKAELLIFVTPRVLD